jgi:catechol 2,3-dioxygenase-like lactoylglutathione lyase family enzyme
MTIRRMEHVRIVVDDLAAATAFFVQLGLKLQARGRSRAVGWTAWWGSTASGWRSRWWRPRTATDGSS